MNKKILMSLVTLFLLSALLVSCSSSSAPLTADQVIQKMVDNSSNMKTDHMTMDMNMTVGGQSLKITTTGVSQKPDKSYMTLSLMGKSMQILSLSPTDIYQRADEKAKWTKVDTSVLQTSGSYYDLTKNPELLLKNYSNAKLLPDASVDVCSSCYHVSFDLDMAGIMKASGLSETVLQKLTFKGPALVECWISKSDFFARKEAMKFTTVSSGQEITMDVQMSLTEINTPVNIPTP